MSASWFWKFNILIMQGNNATPLGVARWAVDRSLAPTLEQAINIIERHAMKESYAQHEYRRGRWVAVAPNNDDLTPTENLQGIREYAYGGRIARGSMLRAKERQPEILEFQMVLF